MTRFKQRKLVWTLISIFALSMAFSSYGQPAAPPDAVVYATMPQGELALYLYAPADHDPDEALPAVLFFFGGGWNGGTPTQFERQARHLAARGIVAITADYRTKNGHGTTPFECVADAITAMRYVRAHADELGIDPDRIAAAGGSAGGHLAIALSTVTAESLIPDDPEQTNFRPNALVLFNPVYDNGPNGYGHGRIRERYVDFSPAHNLHADMPPTLVMLGDRDDLIPVSTAEQVRDDMRALGVRSELIIYENQGHGFFNAGRDAESTMYHATLAAMDEFLVSLGWLAADGTKG